MSAEPTVVSPQRRRRPEWTAVAGESTAIAAAVAAVVAGVVGVVAGAPDGIVLPTPRRCEKRPGR
jgi:negative regulator of sigma E activity